MTLDDTTGKLFIGRLGAAGVSVLNDASPAAGFLPAGAIPGAIAVDPKTDTLFVANYGDNTLTIIDAHQGRAIATVPVGNGPQGVAFDAARNLVYVANTHGDSITVIDRASNKVVATLPAGESPYALAVVPNSTKLYVANGAGDESSTVVDLRQIRRAGI